MSNETYVENPSSSCNWTHSYVEYKRDTTQIDGEEIEIVDNEMKLSIRTFRRKTRVNIFYLIVE